MYNGKGRKSYGTTTTTNPSIEFKSKYSVYQPDYESSDYHYDEEIGDKSLNCQETDVSQKSEPDMTMIYLIVIGLLVLLLIIAIGIGIKFYAERKKIFRSASKLLKGKPIEINKNLNIQEQVELLAYDKRWEFPKNRLKLGIQIGTGHFGRVVKAEALGIKGATETVKTVAVKMVRSENNVKALEALIKELKILIFLGSHLNVVNLLGACTKNISKGDILVIIEYCRFGNLQTYLVNHRNRFVNQLNEFGDMKTEEESDETTVTIRNGVILEQTITQNPPDVNLTIEDSDYIEISNLENSDNYSFGQKDPETVLTQSVTTRDLICWSYQIARGMDYLASKNVFHGDLASRNVLLADNGVVKVADFGNSGRLYNDLSYQITEERLMTIKWMAIETLTDRILSSQSDVWSYGILLWEIFSLGQVPYPGMTVDQQFVKQIQNGYRMEKPNFAPNELGNTMASCWKIDPSERPTFCQLEDIIKKQLESSICDYYVELNFPYEKINEEKANKSVKINLSYLGLAKLLDAEVQMTKSQTLPAKVTMRSPCQKKKIRPKSFHANPHDRQGSIRLGNSYV